MTAGRLRRWSPRCSTGRPSPRTRVRRRSRSRRPRSTPARRARAAAPVQEDERVRPHEVRVCGGSDRDGSGSLEVATAGGSVLEVTVRAYAVEVGAAGLSGGGSASCGVYLCSRPSRSVKLRSASSAASESCVTSSTPAPRSCAIFPSSAIDLAAAGAVEVAGRLVGEDQLADRPRAPGRSRPAGARRRRAARGCDPRDLTGRGARAMCSASA